jgi:hypothetical protein
MRIIAILLAATSGLGAPASLAAQEAPRPMVASAEIDDSGSKPSDDAAAMAPMAGLMGGMYNAEPLTPEQQARLPQAETLIARLIPDGAMAEMSQVMFNSIIGPLEGMMPSGAKPVVAERLGSEVAGRLSEDQAAEVASMLDPAWEEREKRVKGLVPDTLAEIMGLMEPAMRKAMSELYAIRFTSAELADIGSFFATDTGAKYARESFSMTDDPRILAVSMEMMPALFGILGDMEQRMKARMADLPEPRSFDALGNKERNRVAALTGLSVEQIEGNRGPGAIMSAPPPPRPAE